jgi:NAD-dependent deacetylase
MASDIDRIEQTRRWIDAAERVVVLTGAGISTDSGIPDFRGPQGAWTQNPGAEKRSTLQNYLAEPALRAAVWQERLHSPVWTARPNAGHQALVTLEWRGKLHALITQNIDGLHQRAGVSAEKVIEVHGTLHTVMCLGCGWRGAMQQTLDRVRAGEEDPACLECSGLLKSDTISFGQQLIPAVIERAMTVATEGDLFIAIGSTLQVYPVAAAVPRALDAGARLLVINAEPTQFDAVADAVLRVPIGEVLPRLCGLEV